MFATDYRPKTFAEVEGQDLAKETLKSIAMSDGVKVRSILLQGAWGSGKCVPGSTRVITSLGYQQISSLFPDPKEGFNAYCTEVNTRRGKQVSSHFYYQRRQKVKTLHLSNGAKISGTEKHRVMAHVAGSVDLIPLSIIDVDDEILFPIEPQQYGVNDDRAFMLGVLAVKGKVVGNQIKVTCPADLASKMLDSGKWTQKSQRILVADLQEYEDYLDLESPSDCRYLPDYAFNLSVNSRIEFLKGILFAVGALSFSGGFSHTLPVRLKSMQLAEDIYAVLETLGLQITIEETEDYVIVRIPVYQLGFLPEFAEIAAETANEVKNLYNISIPEANAIALMHKEKCPENEYVMPLVYNLKNNGRIAKPTLLKLKELMGGLPKQLEELLNYRTLKVDKVTYSYKDVYDLTVPGAEEFYAQGTINHNTTLARIFAKAVNCNHLKTDGDVCNECDNCKDADRSNSLLYREYDATRVGNVESIKSLLDSLQIKNYEGRRVVCIDEVHTASRQAQSALLKVLEDGVPDTIFVFCCTEEVIKTIKSRSVFLEISTLSVEQIMRRCRKVADMEGLGITDSQLEQVALKSQGHMRDALSILEHYSIAGELALKTSITDFRKFILCLLQKKDCEDILRQVLQYSLYDIQASIRYFLTTCFTAQQGFEAKVRQTGLALKLFKFFYTPEAQQAFKDEAGMEILLRALIESMR